VNYQLKFINESSLLVAGLLQFKLLNLLQEALVVFLLYLVQLLGLTDVLLKFQIKLFEILFQLFLVLLAFLEHVLHQL
jgi:hypothetical protein